MKAAPPYHHGSLREALVEAAVEVVAETGAADVSLRAVARRAGVTHAAAYHHFTDRDALLAAAAAHGLEELTRAMRRGARREATQPEAFRAMGLAYVTFASKNPALYRLMFAAERGRGDEVRAREQAAEHTFRALLEEIAACQNAGVVRGGASVDLALTAWATVHGLASLLLDGQLAIEGLRGRSPRALIDAVLGVYFVGARAAPSSKSTKRSRAT